jgi:hypothetical protein
MASGLAITRNMMERSIQPMGLVTGLVTGSATTPTVTLQSGDLIADQACVTITRSNTGLYVMAITNFLGRRGSVIPMTTAATQGNIVAATTTSYSGTTASVTFSQTDSANSLTDTGNFYFAIFAY